VIGFPVFPLGKCQSDAFGVFGDSFGQPDLPFSVAFVYVQDDGCFARRIILVRINKEEVRAHLANAD
jgi:hypothetical protein